MKFIFLISLFCLIIPIFGYHNNQEENIKKFYWDVNYIISHPDGMNGSPRIALGINNGNGYISPGPLLTFTEGDRVEIIVTNKAPIPLTIHWHGIEHIGTPYADGSSVTQWKIPTGSSYIYRFTLNQHGTYFYHAHGQEFSDGLVGSLIVKEKHSVNPFKGQYTSDDAVLFSALSQRTSTTSFIESNFGYVRTPNFLPELFYPIASMANGLTKKAFDLGETAALIIKPGETKRIRLINADYNQNLLIGFGSSKYFTTTFTPASSISQISVDAQYIEKKVLNCYQSECLGLGNGQRIDILYTAPQHFTHDFIYIVQTNFSDFQNVLHSIYPIVSDSHKKSQIQRLFSNNRPVNPPLFNQTSSQKRMVKSLHMKDIYIELETLVPNSLSYIEPPSIPFGKERVVTIDWRYFQSPAIISPDGTVSYVELGEWRVSIDGSTYKRFMMPDVPTIFDKRRTHINRIDVPLGQVVDIIVYNHDIIQHPFHIHGHQFYLTGRGMGVFDSTPNSNDIKSLNLVNPIRRDVHMLKEAAFCNSNSPPPCETNAVKDYPCAGEIGTSCVPNSGGLGGEPSWTSFRIHFDHEGPWLSHCHFADHVNLGMVQVFVVDDEKEGYYVPEYIPRSTFRKIRRNQQK